jgi:hypothetical protein
MVKSIKALFTTTLLLSGLILSGCLTDGNDDEVTISDFNLSATTVNVSTGAQSVDIMGKVSASENITLITIDVMDSAGTAVTAGFDKKITANTDKDKLDLTDDSKASITVAQTVPSGKYTIKVTVNAGTVSNSKSIVLTVTGGTAGTTGTVVTDVTVTLGAQGATEGSSLDLDGIVVYTSANAKTNSDKIDLVFNSAVDGTVARIMSPAEAKTDGFTLVATWATTNSTKFYKLSGTTFESVTTQEAIDALWSDASALSPAQLDLTGETVVIAKSNMNKTVLLKFNAPSSQTTTATVVVKGTK